MAVQGAEEEARGVISALIAYLLTGPVNSPVPVEYAMASAYLESRGDSSAVSQGRWCGIWQSEARTAARCHELRDPFVAARAYRAEVATWLRYTHGDLRAALRGLGCGVRAAMPGGSCNGYDVRTLRLASRIRLAMLHGQIAKLRARVGS